MFRFTFFRTLSIIALNLVLTPILSAQRTRGYIPPPLSINSNAARRAPISELSPLPVLSIKQIELPFLSAIPQGYVKETVQDTLKMQPEIAQKTIENEGFDTETCIDLSFDSVSIVKIEEKYIEIEYSIINKGTAPAPIFGTKRSLTDNVAVHFYFSGTPRLNRGSILAEGIYLTEGLRETKGMLAPNAVYKNRIKLSLEKKNRFYGVIILQLDAFDILRRECDETNNNFPIVPKWY